MPHDCWPSFQVLSPWSNFCWLSGRGPPATVLNKSASEGLHACLHFHVPPQMMVTGNFWIIAFSLFSFCCLFCPLVRLQRGIQRDQDRGPVEPSLAVHTVALWQWVCNRQDKGIYPVEENKGAIKKKKESTNWGFDCSRLWGTGEFPFRGNLFMKRGTEQVCGSAYLQKDITVLISLHKPFIFRKFWGCGR